MDDWLEDHGLVPGMAFLVDGRVYRVQDGEDKVIEALKSLRGAWAAGQTVHLDHTDPATMGTILDQADHPLAAQGEFVRAMPRVTPGVDPWDLWCRIVLMAFLCD